jgi:hypothetical protein
MQNNPLGPLVEHANIVRNRSFTERLAESGGET